VLFPALLAKQAPSPLSLRQSCVLGSAVSSPTIASGIGTILDEVHHSLEYIVRVMIEADDEARHYLDAVALNLLH